MIATPDGPICTISASVGTPRDSCDVVMRACTIGEGSGAGEEVIEGFVGRFSCALAPQLAQTIPAEIFVALISQFVQSVRGEEHGIARREPHRILVV